MVAFRILAVLTLPLALLACSDDDAETDTGGSTSSTAPTSATDPLESGDDGSDEPDRAADQAFADAVVLTLSDVGAGWELSADEEDEEDEDDAALDQALADCLGVDVSVIAEEDDDIGASATFDQEQARLEGSVDVVASEDEAVRDFEVIDSEQFPGCYGDLLDDELRRDAAEDAEAREAGVTYGGVEMSRLDLPAGLGDDAVGYRATITIEANGVQFESYQDLVLVRRGRAEMTTSVLSNFEPVSLEYTIGLASIMDSRAARA